MGSELRYSRSSFLAVSGILLLFCFQQFILYHTLYYLKNVKVVLYALILDVPLGLYIFLGLVLRSFVSSVRYSILWCMYSVTIIVKMVLLAFLDKSDDAEAPIIGLSNESNDMLLAFFGLYVTPIVFSLFNSASKRSLFQDPENVTVDELLHSDLGLSTTIDLWDIILMFSHLLKYYKVEKKEPDLIILDVRHFVVFIIFVLVTFFLLGLVVPTVDGDYKVEDRFKTNIFNEVIRLVSNCLKMLSKSRPPTTKGPADMKNNTELKSVNEGASSLDMFTMAKFTFIIGFFLIDIPFLAYRLYILARYNVFSLLLYKNFIFLFLRPYRLNMSQLAERDTAKGWQAAFFNTDILSARDDKPKRTEEAFGLLEETEQESETQLLRRFSLKASIRRKKSQIYKSALGPRLLSKLTFAPRPFTKSDPMYMSNKLRGKFARTDSAGARGRSTQDGSVELAAPGPAAATDAVAAAEPAVEVDRHGYRMYVLKMLRKGRTLPIKSFPYAVIMRHWAQFLFGRLENFETAYVANVDNFKDVKSKEFIFLFAALSAVAPRVALVLLFYFRDLRAPGDILANIMGDATFPERFALQLCFAFPFLSFMLFFHTCYLFDSAFVFVRDAVNLYAFAVCLHALKSLLLMYDGAKGAPYPLFVFLLFPLAVTASLANNLVPRGRGGGGRPESRRKALNLRLAFVLLRFSIGPLSLSQRLCSIDLVEMVRIHDALLHAQWSQFVYSLFFRLLVCCALDSRSALVVLLADALLFFLYNTTSQSMRSLMFRKYEVSFVVLRVLKLLKFDWDCGVDRAGDAVTLADVDKYIGVQGMISSPGVVFPPFL